MKANELRIGNYYDNDGIFYKVTPEVIEDVWIAERSWVKPISLTEEWLLEFGFNLITKSTNKYMVKNLAGQPCFFYKNKKLIYQNTIIEYVHQLQNLYFALTGDELK